MLTVGVTILTILLVIILVIVVACQIIEALYPETKLFTMISPLALLVTVLIMLLFLYMFKDCFDYKPILKFMGEFIRDIPTMIKDFISIFMGCPAQP